MKKIIINFFLIGLIISFYRFFQFIGFNGVLPDVVILMVILNGIFFDPLYALIFGFFSGLSLDFFEFYPILGFYSFIYTTLGYLTILDRLFSIDNSLMFSIFLSIFLIIKGIIFFILGLLVLDFGYIVNYFKNIYLLELIYTIIIGIPFFLIFRKLTEKRMKVY